MSTLVFVTIIVVVYIDYNDDDAIVQLSRQQSCKMMRRQGRSFQSSMLKIEQVFETIGIFSYNCLVVGGPHWQFCQIDLDEIDIDGQLLLSEFNAED